MIPQYITPRTFPQLLWELVQKTWARKNVTFTEDKPRDLVSGPVICWKIYRRLPGREGNERNKPRFRDIKEHDSQSQRERYAQWHTIWYQFDIYDVSNTDVNILSEEWEDLVFAANGLTKRFGVDELIFDEEFEDETMPKRQDVFVRSLRYRCILEKRYEKDVSVLQQVELHTLMGRADKIAVPIIRGVTDTDALPDKWVYSLNSVAKGIQGGLNDPSDYINSIDFNTAADSNGTAKLVWIPGRSAPSVGDTYYCSYCIYLPEPAQVV